jgi:hypothetical protein
MPTAPISSGDDADWKKMKSAMNLRTKKRGLFYQVAFFSLRVVSASGRECMRKWEKIFRNCRVGFAAII